MLLDCGHDHFHGDGQFAASAAARWTCSAFSFVLGVKTSFSCDLISSLGRKVNLDIPWGYSQDYILLFPVPVFLIV